jgi:hypothetical protein
VKTKELTKLNEGVLEKRFHPLDIEAPHQLKSPDLSSKLEECSSLKQILLEPDLKQKGK